MYTQTFENAENITDSIGSKAINLIKIKQAGWPVPDGFVVLPYTFRRFIKFNELSLNDNAIQEKIMKAEIPEDIYLEIVEAFTSIKKNFKAVA
ncbi:PEP/pyruvate-binding domain-containing protein, partial [Mammaliicoccus vitulinus]|uniref:PEP/pyruvate-binding domain-containing protein n=1 Tax=Mammaliicoccus vitulinus TaxID=71237 RepID=UPI003F94DE8A